MKANILRTAVYEKNYNKSLDIKEKRNFYLLLLGDRKREGNKEGGEVRIAIDLT